jgi:hypothetical protein
MFRFISNLNESNKAKDFQTSSSPRLFAMKMRFKRKIYMFVRGDSNFLDDALYNFFVVMVTYLANCGCFRKEKRIDKHFEVGCLRNLKTSKIKGKYKNFCYSSVMCLLYALSTKTIFKSNLAGRFKEPSGRDVILPEGI